MKTSCEQGDRGRRLNLVMAGLEPNENLTCKQIVEQMFVRDLKIPHHFVDAFIYQLVSYENAFK